MDINVGFDMKSEMLFTRRRDGLQTSESCRIDFHRSKYMHIRPSDGILGDTFDGVNWSMSKSGELKTVEDIVRKDEWVVDKIVKNQLLRPGQPSRVVVAEMKYILRVPRQYSLSGLPTGQIRMDSLSCSCVNTQRRL